MESKIGYLNNIGFVRVLACITILLYHMNILKGGYLSVCIFFVLSGYFACVSLFRKENFSFKDYYLNKLKNIYIPLIVVVFISIAVISLFDSINWFNLKPETTSVLLGYNNFWQLDANLDYFARHVSSPFMHLWYMGIILQFDLFFPFIYLLLRKVGDKIHKFIPCILTLIFAIGATIFFYKSSLEENIMVTYYNTFTRIFSLLFGMALGFTDHYYQEKKFIPFKNININKLIFYLYIIITMILCLFIESTSKYFAIIMILVTLISLRLITYGSNIRKDNLSIFDKIVKSLSDISYEIYLVQYPIIFIFQYINLNKYLELFLIIFITILTSYLLNFSLSFKKEKNKILCVIALFLTLFVSIFGCYKYVIAKDYTEEMKALEKKLETNNKIMEQRKQEYADKLKKEQEDWLDTLKDFEVGEEELKNVVSNLSIVGIGDSVMLGAIDELQKKFPNGYFDAAVSRTAYVANDIVQNLSYAGLLGEPIVINLGANGDCDDYTKDLIMKSIGNRKVFWLNVTNDNDVRVNDDLVRYASKYKNLYVIDWNSISKGHYDYFIADGIHLTAKGKKAFVNAIYDSIYKVYLDEYNLEKQAIIDEYEEKQNQKITFIGNSLLINTYDLLEKNFPFAEIITNSDYNYESIRKELIKKINSNSLSHRLVLLFDKNSNMTLDDYKKIIELCLDHKIYIITIDIELNSLISKNVEIIDFTTELKNNKDYYMADGIHLSQKGNEKLNELLLEEIK